MATTLQEAITEYLDNLPQGKITPEVANIWRMCDEHGPIVSEVVAGLDQALGGALENLPDVAGALGLGDSVTIECCKDIAAMAHLLTVGEDGKRNIEAYI